MLPSGKYPETRSFYFKQFKTVRFLKINLYVDTAYFSSAFTEKIYLLRFSLSIPGIFSPHAVMKRDTT